MSARIRLATVADAAAMQAIYEPYVRETAVSFETRPPSVAEFERRIADVLQRYPWLVCVDALDEVAGYVYASRHHERAAFAWSVDLAVYVAQPVQHSGVGRALYTSLVALLRLQGYYNAYAGITLPNDASVGLHRAVGFEPVGVMEHVGYKLGAWHAVSYWALELQPRIGAPAPPLSLEEAQRDPRWAGAMAAGEGLLKL
ncbi:MAG TPA: arsinothricin resistance N-acetyltransferase ArsN1 family B [Dehalococcoidia bacterium]|nr:arsinothricin resistance N-acetyltransferase ArsN1 family B [Dehalococcoidia bacterium]